MRGVAILLVLLHHFTILEPISAIDHSLKNVLLIGWSGVDLFFVLSGFLITGILIEARGSRRYFTSFYARRTLRIFPLYYLIVFLAFVVLPRVPAWHDLLVGTTETEQWPYWVFLMNVEIAAENSFEHGILDVAWSLAIEEQFYIVWAAVVWLCPPRWLGTLCAVIMAAAPLARAAALAGDAQPISVYVLTPYRADALATGALCAWAAHRGWLRGQGSKALAFGIIALGGVAALCWLGGDTGWANPHMQGAGYSLLALTAAGMVVGAVALPPQHWWPRLVSTGWLRAFGKYSYCLYLIHLSVMRPVRELVLAPQEFAAFGSPWIGQLTFYAAAIAPAFALAWLSWRLIERPILTLKERFPY